MTRPIAVYGLAIAVAAFLLRWLEYRHAILFFPTEIYIVCIAVLFAAVGIWAGHHLTRRPGNRTFKRNDKAMQSLGISEREYEVLVLLAHGHSNQEIADKLFVSRNTIKTHLAHAYDKLGVSRRTQAIRKSRALRLIP
jgi:DNA-binding CsgD family transcriptional regulator